MLCESPWHRCRQPRSEDPVDYWGAPASIEQHASPDRFRFYEGDELKDAGLLPAGPTPERRPSVLNLIDFRECDLRPPLGCGLRSYPSNKCWMADQASCSEIQRAPCLEEVLAGIPRPCLARSQVGRWPALTQSSTRDQDARVVESTAQAQRPLRGLEAVREALVGVAEARRCARVRQEAFLLWHHAAKECCRCRDSERLQQDNAKLRLKISKALTLMSQR